MSQHSVQLDGCRMNPGDRTMEVGIRSDRHFYHAEPVDAVSPAVLEAGLCLDESVHMMTNVTCCQHLAVW